MLQQPLLLLPCRVSIYTMQQIQCFLQVIVSHKRSGFMAVGEIQSQQTWSTFIEMKMKCQGNANKINFELVFNSAFSSVSIFFVLAPSAFFFFRRSTSANFLHCFSLPWLNISRCRQFHRLQYVTSFFVFCCHSSFLKIKHFFLL